MTRKTKTNAIMIATAIATLLSATATFADATSNNSVQAPKFSQTHSGETRFWCKSRLDSLVKDGTVTKSKEIAIQSAIAKKFTTENEDFQCINDGFITVMDGLVKNGTITMDQEDAIQNAVTIANQDAAANGDFHSIDNYGSKYVMDGLLQDGTITKTQKIAIQSGITTAKEDGTITKAEEVAIQDS